MIFIKNDLNIIKYLNKSLYFTSELIFLLFLKKKLFYFFIL